MCYFYSILPRTQYHISSYVHKRNIKKLMYAYKYLHTPINYVRMCVQIISTGLLTSEANDKRFISPPDRPFIRPVTPMMVFWHFFNDSCRTKRQDENKKSRISRSDYCLRIRSAGGRGERTEHMPKTSRKILYKPIFFKFR